MAKEALEFYPAQWQEGICVRRVLWHGKSLLFSYPCTGPGSWYPDSLLPTFEFLPSNNEVIPEASILQ